MFDEEVCDVCLMAGPQTNEFVPFEREIFQKSAMSVIWLDHKLMSLYFWKGNISKALDQIKGNIVKQLP